MSRQCFGLGLQPDGIERRTFEVEGWGKNISAHIHMYSLASEVSQHCFWLKILVSAVICVPNIIMMYYFICHCCLQINVAKCTSKNSCEIPIDMTAFQIRCLTSQMDVKITKNYFKGQGHYP